MVTDRVNKETDDLDDPVIEVVEDVTAQELFPEPDQAGSQDSIPGDEHRVEQADEDPVEYADEDAAEHADEDTVEYTVEHTPESNPLVDDGAPEETVTLGIDEPPPPPTSPEPTPPTENLILEMRQVAGLTAGSMMKLSLGRAFEFNESNEGGSFSLRVLENGEVVVHPGSAKTVVDEVEVTEPTLIGNAILNVSSACFSVRRPRASATNKTRMEAINATFAAAPVISVPVLGIEEPLSPEQLAGSRLGALLNRSPLTRQSVGQGAWDFLQTIRETRSLVAERHRLMHPDPEELKTRLSRLDPGLWERGLDHALFGRFSVAYATIPWEPRFDNPELIPEVLHEPIVEMSLLPWVPVTANLFYGPLAIVGRRAARLAACRHAVLSLAALSVPGDVRFSIRADRTKADSWNWCRALPPIMATDSDSDFEVMVVDGVDSLENAVSDLAANASIPDVFDEDSDTMERSETRRNSSAMILLADSIEEIDHPCGTVLQIHPDGTASITNHLNETIQVTPIGATEAFAHDMATRVADILTDSFL